MALAAKDAAAEPDGVQLSSEDKGTAADSPSLMRRILPALLCVFSDYYGLSALVPMIPFHLKDADGRDDDSIATWFGIINTVQYGGVVLGCIGWGMASDRFGPMRIVQATMVGNVVCFALTGLAAVPLYLTFIRFFAGFFSPLVPVVSYLFSVCTAEDAAFAASSNSLAILSGFGAGTASVALYGPLGFAGTAWLSAGLALGALAATALTPAGACWAQAAPGEMVQAAEKPVSEGVRAALCSPTFQTQAASVSTLMLYFQGAQTFLISDLRERFDFGPAEISAFFVTLIIWHLCAAIFFGLGEKCGVPNLAKLHGMQPFISVGSVLNALSCGLLIIPTFHNTLPVLLTLYSLANIGFSCAVIPAQARAKMIGAHQTRHGQGQITGISKVTQAFGQALGPAIASELLILAGPAAPWVFFASLQTCVILLYVLLGMPFTHEPDWKKLALPPPSQPNDVDRPSVGRPSAREIVELEGGRSRRSSARFSSKRSNTASVREKILGSFSNVSSIGVDVGGD